MRIIAHKGAIKLIEFDGGNYKVIYFDEGIQKTLLLTKDVMLAFNYYISRIKVYCRKCRYCIQNKNCKSNLVICQARKNKELKTNDEKSVHLTSLLPIKKEKVKCVNIKFGLLYFESKADAWPAIQKSAEQIYEL